MVNYTNIATECAVSAVTVKEYFQILEDTLIGRMLPSFQKNQNVELFWHLNFIFRCRHRELFAEKREF